MDPVKIIYIFFITGLSKHLAKQKTDYFLQRPLRIELGNRVSGTQHYYFFTVTVLDVCYIHLSLVSGEENHIRPLCSEDG